MFSKVMPSQSEDIVFNLPEIFDANFDAVDIEPFGLLDNMRYDNVTNTLIISDVQ
jgi:hypothetical protein